MKLSIQCNNYKEECKIYNTIPTYVKKCYHCGDKDLYDYRTNKEICVRCGGKLALIRKA